MNYEKPASVLKSNNEIVILLLLLLLLFLHMLAKIVRLKVKQLWLDMNMHIRDICMLDGNGEMLKEVNGFKWIICNI